MAFTKKFFITSSALALLSRASSNSSIPSSCTVKSAATAQSDLDSLSSCKTISGSLTLSGNLINPTLNGVQVIDGDLNIENSADIVAFNANSLTEITGDLLLQNLTSIQTLSLESLNSVGSISLVALPVMDNFVITSLTSADNIVISDTAVSTLQGFNNLKKVEVFNINNNPNLVSIDSPIKSISNGLSISSNGDDLALVFDQLIWANNITVLGAGEVEFPLLTKVNQSIGFINNTFEYLNIDNVTEIGVTFNVVSNDELTELSASNLETLGGALVIANNSKLTNVTGFPSLTSIGGALDVIGPFDSFSIPKLNSIKGGADVESNKTNFSCDALNKLEKSGKIQGNVYKCKAGSSSTTATLSSGTSSGSATTMATSASGSSSASASSTSSTKKSKAAAPAQSMNKAGLFGGLAAVAVAML
ncbi:related to Cell wall protein ECM33 [Hanseniaspora guilliermondii]|uniref:Related to Cell wall protein ECM33 n=1 Tax=Hanseniaspora guilliermondii TaxID=56406 RepID=A0A1L0B3A8_9ASCO|nr:related to Cell wall protein ECM33 [Hanseniaspora guilliermondii]